jgi:hypothetical protein
LIILDVGAGFAYLSSVLALEYGYNVVALDSNPEFIKGASSRYRNILELYGKRSRPIIGNLEFMCKTINFNQDYNELIAEIETLFGWTGERYMIIGLHTCGSLATSMINGFAAAQRSNSKLVTLYNIACCYQKLSNDLPMCKANQGFIIGPGTKMAACQAVWRMDAQTLQESTKRLYYRSVLQKILVEKHATTSDAKISRAVKKLGVDAYKSPLAYCKQALQRLSCDNIDDEYILEMFDRYQGEKKLIGVVWTLRAMTCNVIESFILYDRVQCVTEWGYNCTLEPVFDPKISPRNMALTISV